jgi:uncharacterized protein involved in exopolysaccharide biosynthesis
VITEPQAKNTEPTSLELPRVPLHSDSQDIDEIDLLALLRPVWIARYALMLVTAIGLACGTTYALLATPWYRAESILIVANDRSHVGLAAKLGGLASLAGYTMPELQSAEPVALLRSRQIVKELISDRNILPVLFSDQWDAEIGDWRVAEPTRRPDLRDGSEYFQKKILAVTEDLRTGLVTVAVEWTDPVLAAQWTQELVQKVNKKMQIGEIDRATRNISYLRRELAATDNVALQQSISQVVESEMQRLMLARGNDEFAFRVVDHADSPKHQSRPQRLLVIVASGLFGLIGGLVVIVIRALFSSANSGLGRSCPSSQPM